MAVHIPFEDWHLLTRLERLWYVIDRGEAPSRREAEIGEIGAALGHVQSQVPALHSEISSARSERSELVHLRLYELARSTGTEGARIAP